MAGKKKKSTTRSGTNLESLELYTFFLDRALQSYALRDALKALGAHVEMHRDYFPGVEVLSSRVVPVALGQLFVVPLPGDQALEDMAHHPEIVPVAKLIELAGATERLHLRQPR
jgi:hypothetical protein